MPLTKEPRKMFTTQLFHQFLVDLVVCEDLNRHSEAFHQLILLLRDAMEEKNIPHLTSLQKMVIQEWVRLMHWLKAHLQGSLGRISFTMDGWSDGTVFPFIAVTAHWVELVEIRPLPSPDPSQPPIPQPPTVLCLRAATIGFYGLLVSHTGQHLAKAFYNILEQLEILHKIGHITVDNASK
ncbi:hypothetical protein AAF712_014468 [Marasmius tenuissimus]|uniref:Transposase n=1 Tax=Marasmius tenuissimus TaxID=585030 RepID=A0ABR2ZBA0_9AGAR